MIRSIFAFLFAFGAMKVAGDANPWRVAIHKPTPTEIVISLIMFLIFYEMFFLVLPNL